MDLQRKLSVLGMIPGLLLRNRDFENTIIQLMAKATVRVTSPGVD